MATLQHNITTILTKNLVEVGEDINNINVNELNPLSIFIKKLSNDMPIFYSVFSILFAIILGVAAAFIRKFFSNLRKKYAVKAK